MREEGTKMEKLDGKSMRIVEHNIGKLKELFPEVFSEGKIKFDQLQELLGNYVTEDEDHFNFTWHGKRRASRLAQTPSTGTLRPCKEESIDWDSTQNLFIEGDNLEVLKLLQKSYHREVKMIYIDPPYNTGNDFVYEDDFKDGVRNYLELTGQLNSEGKKMGTNSSSVGRYHTNWLNMMYPRLKLARNLLRDDGVIFISIDDNESENLKKLCNEVFGEENFIAQAGWQKVYSPKNQARYLSNDYEFIFIYCKQISNFEIGLLPRTEKMNKRYKNPDNDPRGNWKSGDLVAAGERSGGHYIVNNPYTGEKHDVPPGKHWAFSKAKMEELLADNRIYWGKNNDSFPSSKQFLTEVKQGRVASSLFSYKDYGHTDEAKKDFIKLFGEKGRTIFETLKPVKLTKQLARIANIESDDIVLDFFAGSGTTAQSIFSYNEDEDASVKFILIQIPEKTEEKSTARQYGYSNIAELTKERIRRATKKYGKHKPDYNDDLGFKVFKLDSSNIKRWEADFDTLEQDLLYAIDNIKQDRSREDILFELLLKYGLKLTVTIETRTIEGKTVYSIGLGALVVCLDEDISMDVVNGIGALKEELKPEIMRVVFKDDCFEDDVVKTNALQTLKRYGIDDIKSF